MADLYEIERAIVGLIAGGLFPNTTYTRGSVATSPAVGAQIKLYRGEPEAGALKKDLNSGITNVTVFPLDGMTRNTTRFFTQSGVIADVPATITATVSGATVTFGGTVTGGNVVGVQFGQDYQVAAYAYAATGADTLTSVASALAAKINGATTAGDVLTLPNALNVKAAAMAPQSVLTEIRRQDQGIRVTVWSQTPQVRDAVTAVVDQGLANLRDSNGNLTERFVIKPGETAWLRYLRTGTSDKSVRSGVWQRDIFYTVQYPTTAIEADPVMLFGGGPITFNTTIVEQFGAAAPS